MNEKLYRETPMRKHLREVALSWRKQGEPAFTLNSLAQAVGRNPNQHVRAAVKQWVKEGWVFEYEYITDNIGLAKAYTFLKPDPLPLPF
jgi:hypothetical protein